MDINLTIYDMNLFLDKYTRFITKDIYISNKIYNNFLDNYNYLYEILDKDRFLYADNKLYKKIIDINNGRNSLLKLHNTKYLKSAINKYNSFFDKVIVSEKLDTKSKMIVLAEEENTYVVDIKNYESLLVSKLKYLIDYNNYHEDKILVLVSTNKEEDILNKYCNKNNLNINIYTIRDYSNKLLRDNYLLDDNKLYDFFVNYIVEKLFKDKKNFESFYKAFSKYIYLNKDYKKYDTFKDYHNYMYKRKYLSSKLSLKKFNESEINKRKTYLRTINNEILKNKQMVDIANFLYLNNIEYICVDDGFELLDKNIYIKLLDSFNGENTYKDDTIYLYKKYDNGDTYLKRLVYELIKRRYPLELVSDDVIYDKLLSNNIENYFSEFITKYLIPLIKYYDHNKYLDELNISILQKEEFLKLYNIYINYLEKNKIITNRMLLKRVEEEINCSKYKYLFLVGDIELNVKIPTFIVVNDYKKTELIKDNIKLLYDYKNYLYNNQIIPIRNTYINREEINSLTDKFLKDNLDIINKSIKNTNKIIDIYEYEDNNRLHIYGNIESICFDISNKYDNLLIGVKSLKDINILINNNNFSKLDNNTIFSKNKKSIRVEEVLKIDKLYDTIVLPYIIKDDYHEELNFSDYQYNIKVLIYVALTKCRKKVVLLCPKSKRSELDKLLGILN